jgi:uncharacterized protein YciI
MGKTRRLKSEASMQFMVIMRMRNPKDPDAQRRRNEVRPAHLAGAAKLHEAGHLHLGGAIFDDDGNPAGSGVIAEFDSRDALEAWLRNDPYTKAGVWQDFEIIPFQVAPHYLERHGS